MAEFQDDFTTNYSNHRQLGELQDSALSRLMSRGEAPQPEATEEEQVANTETSGRFAQGELARQFLAETTEEEKLAALGAPDVPLEEPLIDPVSAAIGGGTAGVTLGKRAISPIFKAATGAVSGVTGEVIVGGAAEAVEGEVEGAGLPLSLVGGFLTGATVEKGIENVLLASAKKGKAIPGVLKAKEKLTPEKTQEIVQTVKKNIDEGNVEADQLTKDSVAVLQEQEAAVIKKREVTAEKELEKSLGREKSPSFSIVKRNEAESVLENVDADIKDKAININLSRINSEDDVKQLIQKVSDRNKPAFTKAKRGVQSNKQTEALANLINMDTATLLSRRQGQAFNAEEALAARQLLVSSSETVLKLAQKVSGPNPAKLDEIALRKAITLHRAIQEQVTGATAEAGRALQQFNIKAKSTKGKLKQLDDIITATGDGQITIKDIASAISDMKDPRQINAFIPKALKAKTVDVFMEAWINGLLSGPQTHAVNTLSNSLVATWQIPERFFAASFSKALGSGDEGVKFGESMSQAYGLVRGIEDGIKAAVKTFQGEPVDIINKLEVNHPRAISAEALEVSGPIGRAVDLLGKVVRVPGAALGVEDAFFKGVGYRMELQAQAYRTASAEGLSGDAFSARVTQIVNNPPEDIHLASIDASRYQTFTNELTGIGRDIQRFSNKYPLMKVIIPFVRTPANIAKFSISRSPFAPILKEVRNEIKAGGAKRDVALARISLGSSVMAMTSMWAAEGKVTGSGPVDPNVKSSLYLSGWQPFSIKIGDKYHSYSRLEPLGTLLGIAADYTDISGQLDQREADELAVAITASVAKNITSKTFLSGISDTIKALDDPQRYGDRYIQRLGASVVPFSSLLAQVARVQDPVMRETRTILDTVKSRIPGYSKDLPAKKNIFAEPITLSGGLGPDIISPIYQSEEINGKLGDELEAHEVSITMPSNIIAGVELSLKQEDKLIDFTAGPIDPDDPNSPTLKEALNQLVNFDEDYKNATDGVNGGKSILIRQTINEYKRNGRELLLDSDEELERDIDAIQEAQELKFGE